MDICNVDSHPVFGLSAFASRPITKGDIVLSEFPLLETLAKSDPLQKQAVKLLLQRPGAEPTFRLSNGVVINVASHVGKSVRRFLPYVTASEAIRLQVIGGMQNTAPTANSALGELESPSFASLVTTWAAEQILTHLLPYLPALIEGDAKHCTFPALDLDVISRVLFAFELNAHDSGDGRYRDDRDALIILTDILLQSVTRESMPPHAAPCCPMQGEALSKRQ